MSFIFVPVLASMGISPDMTQCAFRIGDSATNAITPVSYTHLDVYKRQALYRMAVGFAQGLSLL